MANAISPCVRPTAAKAASPKLKKLLAERMLDSAPAGVPLRLVSFSKANAPSTGVVLLASRPASYSETEAFTGFSALTPRSELGCADLRTAWGWDGERYG